MVKKVASKTVKKRVFKLYKVLTDSAYRGLTGSVTSFDYTPYLPVGKTPGKWLPNKRPIMCRSGWHVTRRPHQWGGDCARTKVFLVETRGKRIAEMDTGYANGTIVKYEGDKTAHTSIRLVKELKGTEKRKVNRANYQKVRGE